MKFGQDLRKLGELLGFRISGYLYISCDLRTLEEDNYSPRSAHFGISSTIIDMIIIHHHSMMIIGESSIKCRQKSANLRYEQLWVHHNVSYGSIMLSPCTHIMLGHKPTTSTTS